MKGRNLIFTGVATTLIGIILILCRQYLASGGVVETAGVLFVLAGVLNITIVLGSRGKDGQMRFGVVGTVFAWIANAAVVLVGLAMLIFSDKFVAFSGYLFGVLVALAALFQVSVILFGSRAVRLHPSFLIIPALLTGAAIFLFIRKPEEVGEHIIMIVSGISLILFGISSVVEGILIGKANRALKLEQQEEQQEDDTVIFVDEFEDDLE
ncbi:MAG: hypothetical protein J1F05_01125 [Muribaculaceae bacterium]|nr:hypothetical protein [Muribaculaceae bacterium]